MEELLTGETQKQRMVEWNRNCLGGYPDTRIVQTAWITILSGGPPGGWSGPLLQPARDCRW